MKFKKRTHTCGELKLEDAGKDVTLNGWVSKVRDLGGILFIDLRDRYGITQLKVDPEKKDIYETAAELGHEFVISAGGKVIERSSKNKNIPTGEIEIDVDAVEILNRSEVPPFVIEEDVKAAEDLRLKYRYLDLRRKTLSDNFIIRSKVYQIVRKFFEKHNFVEVETPMLMKSTPEGARDYLVPSRVHKGKFYALPQSPQLYKQILMVAGLDRYIQICKCFRDEDLRADRQPEFTQIDLEMSFVTQEDVFEILEEMFASVWKEILGIDIQLPFKKMTYDEVMNLYGTDKPDLRIPEGMEINNITNEVKGSEFKVFEDAVNSGGIIAGIRLSGKDVTRKITDGLTEFVKKHGFAGLGYIKFNEDGSVQSPISKFLSEEKINSIKSSFNIKPGGEDVVFILSGERAKVLKVLGLLRNKIAEDFDLIDRSRYEFLWVIDFPLFAYDEENNSYVGEHHVFTMPKDEYIKYLDSNIPEEIMSIRASCYDLVLNGNEVTSGSIRIHKPEIQKKVFDIMGLSDEEANEKFGFILEAFKYGAPPHGGAAVGLDRVVAILCGMEYIRDVIAFPKTISAQSLMDDCPGVVSEKQLKDLGIKLEEKVLNNVLNN